MAVETDYDVLIVGLGPVGAALAVLLADAGVRTLAVEREVEVYPLPRAAHFDHEIMRLFRTLGVAEEVLRHARPAPPYEFRAADGQLLLRFDQPAQPSPSGWTGSYMFHQPGVENALRARLAALPAAEVRLAHRFESLVQHPDHIEANVIGPEGPLTIRARYLVGCDGGSSPVRTAIGAILDDYQFDEPWLVVDAAVLDGARLPDVNLQICDPARPTTCVLMGPGRHRWEFMLLPGETPDQVLDEAFLRALLAPWDCADDVVIERKAVYRFHGLVAKTWRDRRVLLAGDSAHQMPPFAGQGMCSGLRDAANLAWKLKTVLRGDAEDSLLDTYQLERDPHVRTYIALAIGMGQVVCTLDPEIAAQRDAGLLAQRAAGGSPLPPAAPPPFAAGCVLAGGPAAGSLFPQPWGAVTGRHIGLDEVLGDEAWLISNLALQAPPGVHAVALHDPRLSPFRDALSAWLARHGVEAVLVRPDRYVFGSGAPHDLLSAYAAMLTPVRETA
ncbi:bifunctional 3-(3-hydroxy-phenyl)propionate/3-hydroxycinnamic acid hydroxylase [Phenylobacterium sp.]|uniref:bifunctional 3-(3-hydroxy-phenyl)propionate/3-hydroxycinnamic acid hydroxylase n=1 Tax=Phenylobacterium sp. TaxID=1871053 RepID=UPI002732D205|nr:bifunctional 3-(3-hydroxy-phenyl)propionate/3-hydroxycinnamic acid hydroxylase [Phenylobacterium sp.]MDP3855766.1 bifunctional 3-(3-hydroxy-phenyl)propionate/3-hydroxycinnamic acid hydroxylase [Phenylobacterium sp.]